MKRAEVSETLGSAQTRRALAAMLQSPRFEVIPLPGVVDDVVAHLPPGATVTVTSSPAKGPGVTVEVAAELAARGFHAVPHLAATQYAGQDELTAALERLRDAGVTELFLIGGDGSSEREEEPNGAGASEGNGFRDGLQLLGGVVRSAPGVTLGMPGYPEGHPSITEEVLDDSLVQKTRLAEQAGALGCVVTQLCFDPQVVLSWASRLRRAHGVQAPVFAGIPGAVGTARLLRIAMNIGVGDSLRFLRGRGGLARRLAAPGPFDPTPLAASLAAGGADVVVSGIHLYTFNALEETEAWRQRLLARLEKGEPE